jgi:hypothetical protein
MRIKIHFFRPGDEAGKQIKFLIYAIEIKYA